MLSKISHLIFAIFIGLLIPLSWIGTGFILFDEFLISCFILFSCGNDENDGNYENDGNDRKQAGAELCQAQAQVGLPGEAELILSSMEVPSIFSKLFYTLLD